MAGGIGSRFWPLSRNDRPKQFIDILGTGKTFIRQTYERISALVPPENVIVVTSDSYREQVLEQLPEVRPENVLCEPLRRNTAPCIAYASYRIQKENPRATVIVTPSDHLVLDRPEFERILRESADFAAGRDALVTIGIRPSRPETGYGYIQIDNEVPAEGDICKVKLFTEKPNAEVARAFVESGDFLWNAGVFVWSLPSIIRALRRYVPEINNIFAAGMEFYGTPGEKDYIDRIYPECRNVSVDYGILEKADNVYVCRADFGWSDIGTWGSLFAHSARDECGNAADPEQVLAYDTAGTLVRLPEGKLAVVEGLKDYIVVDNGDALLICRRENEQFIRIIVDDLKKAKKDRFL